MQIAGPLAAQQYIVGSIKEIYASQGQTVNSRHVCTITRQMFSKIRVLEVGETNFFPSDVVDLGKFQNENELVAKGGGRQAIGERLILGIAKVSLHSDSWLSAASFQETVRVLVEASSAKSVDPLSDIKSNVIIGRRIPTLQYFNNNLEEDNEYYEGNLTDITEIKHVREDGVVLEIE